MSNKHVDLHSIRMGPAEGLEQDGPMLVRVNIVPNGKVCIQVNVSLVQGAPQHAIDKLLASIKESVDNARSQSLSDDAATN